MTVPLRSLADRSELNRTRGRVARLETSVNPIAAFQVKVGGETDPVVTGDGQVVLAAASDMDGLQLIEAEAFLSTAGSTATTVQIRNITGSHDMLSTAIGIDSSETTSYTAATPPVIDTDNNGVSKGDLIAIDVDLAGTGAKGLGVILRFA